MEQELVAIQVDIAGKSFPLKVNVAEKQEVIEVVDALNQRLQHFQAQFPRQDKVDYLSMALLTYASDLRKAANTDAIATSTVAATPPPPAQVVVEPSLDNTSLLSEEISGKLSDLEALVDKLLA